MNGGTYPHLAECRGHGFLDFAVWTSPGYCNLLARGVDTTMCPKYVLAARLCDGPAVLDSIPNSFANVFLWMVIHDLSVPVHYTLHRGAFSGQDSLNSYRARGPV